MTTIFKRITDFIREIYKQPKGSVPLHEPVFLGNEKKYIAECIDTKFVSSIGRFVGFFEEKMAVYTGAKSAVACVNGTNALHLALKMAGVSRDDEVITQPLTFIATANAIAYCNAHPIFLDVDRDTLGLSPSSLEVFLQEHAEIKQDVCYNKQTKRKISACVPVHVFGHPCKIDLIVKICKQYNIPVVEDAAESVGSFYKGQHTGTFGKIGILSFNGNKIITTGGGGMLMFQDEELAKEAKHLTTQAKIPHPWELNHDRIGYNYRMPNINAALGVAQIEKIDYYIERKQWLSEQYSCFFKDLDIQFFNEPENSRSNYWLNTIFFKSRSERNDFLTYANENGIMARPAWTLMSKLPMFKDSITDSLINATLLEEQLANIPSSVIVNKL